MKGEGEREGEGERGRGFFLLHSIFIARTDVLTVYTVVPLV